MDAETIKGPFEIEYGLGWEPTESYWTEKYRCHIYLGDRDEKVWLEIARVGEEDFPGVRCNCKSHSDAKALAHRILETGLPFTAIVGVDWIPDGLGINHWIPHPPDLSTVGNIATFIQKG